MVHLRFVIILMLKILMWGGIAFIAWATISCEEFCEESNRTSVVINFYSSVDDALLTVKKVEIKGIENDSLLYSPSFRQTDFSQVMLPVNPSVDIMSFSIKNDTLPADTIIIKYTRRTGFISSECGCVTYAEIKEELERTSNTMTNMVVTNHNVTTVSYRDKVINAENIRIYY